MKLYCTVASERATKGQGGNKFISIDIGDENKEIIRSMSILPHDEGFLILWHSGGDSSLAMVQKRHGGGYYVDYKESLKFLEVAKGEKQKGDKCPLCKKERTPEDSHEWGCNQ